MSFPDIVNQHLRSVFYRDRRPFCCRIDSEYRLLDVWGDAAHYGFDGIRTGESLEGYAPFLIGLLGETPERLPFVTTAAGTMEVYVVPDADSYYVVFLDAADEHQFLRERQQVSNELRLLHQSQERLIEKQRNLIGELVETRTELDHQRLEAERANASKGRFIAMMSHEFRTPLASIINYADLSLEPDAETETIRKSAEAIARASRHMSHLVDTVLDEARLEAGQYSLNERGFRLPELLDDIATIMAPLAAEKALSFGVFVEDDLPELLFADDVCLRQILINLLANAVKFTDTGGIRLQVGWRDDTLHAAVIDTGPGIPPEDQERMFQAFERAADADRDRKPGTGLGLSISLKLARLMRGQIKLVSAPGEGCRFDVTVPASVHEPDSDQVLPTPNQEFRAQRPATILVCDDDEDLLALSEYYLQRAGYGLLVARDGEEAVTKALAYGPDLVLMDINVPRLAGSAAAAKLREGGFEAPILALTASDVRKLDRVTFTGSLRKPIQMPRLLAQIQDYL